MRLGALSAIAFAGLEPSVLEAQSAAFYPASAPSGEASSYGAIADRVAPRRARRTASEAAVVEIREIRRSPRRSRSCDAAVRATWVGEHVLGAREPSTPTVVPASSNDRRR